MNGTTIIATSQAAYNALFSGLYLSGQQCLPSTNGASTATFYNSTSDMGAYVNSANTNTL